MDRDRHRERLEAYLEAVIQRSVLLPDWGGQALEKMRLTINDISLVDGRLLIPFKARAFLDLLERKAAGENVDARHIRKHRGDVFRLVQLLPGKGSLALADSIRADLGEFLGQALRDRSFNYATLKLPLTLDDAAAVLGRHCRLEGFG